MRRSLVDRRWLCGLVLGLLAGCAWPEASPGSLGPRGRDMPDGPGLFSGPSGTFTVIRRPLREAATAPPPLTAPPPDDAGAAR